MIGFIQGHGRSDNLPDIGTDWRFTVITEHSIATTAIVLDDDADTRFAIKRILGKCGCEVHEAESVNEAIALMETQTVDVVFSDMRLPGASGGEDLLDIILERELDVHIILMSCAMDTSSRSRLLNKGASDCVQKPFFKDTCEKLLANITGPVKRSA